MPTVVLGYVPKPEGEAALAASIAEARLRQADLVVVNSFRSHHGDDEADERLRAELEDVRARVEEAGVVVDVRHPETGLEAAEDLLAIAEEVAAELVVIGLRRRTPVGKLILGSNAQRILLDSSCPVLAVKTE
ncbi:MAG TPA: universal stress protein [Nocardioides sp.]|uniref:universal stress protein n=1 Tax=uncultured Nocardioides sp. TaxID=198441 RepID=UPI000EC278C9|nr:universal stress protein [uncultured Nocardioides sp.]HCB02653.1 universal stress protein [Nocardioides sp.]HRD60933.1 universal stress protein [Nocardioides sp.]HRI98249.1 universal stress protein [Nocardioides sp.]HRK47964.1 universal stress protein [Nocardioides sp.]